MVAKKIPIVSFFFFFVVYALFSSATPDVLFVLYDNGDMNALEPLGKKLTERRASYAIAAFGTAYEKLRESEHLLQNEKDHSHQIAPLSFKENRGKTLEDSPLQTLTKDIMPKVVISGMASAVQAQVVNHFAAAGVPCYVFYDNISPIGEMAYVRDFLETINTSPRIQYMMPATVAREGFKAHTKTKAASLHVVGNHAFESWRETAANTNLEDLSRRLNIDLQKPVILFGGGRDDTYETYLREFIAAAKDISYAEVLITYHPVTDGSLEKRLLDEVQNPPHMRVIEKGIGLSTEQISPRATVVVCHKSSIGFQALAAGKPVLFIAEEAYKNPVIEHSLAARVSKAAALLQKLQDFLGEQREEDPPSLDAIGVPKEPSLSVIERLIGAHLQIGDAPS